MSRLKTGLFAFVAGVVTLVSCGDSATEALSTDYSDPEVFEAAIRQTFLSGAGGVLDAMDRVITAVAGGGADGVVISPNPNGADALISVDFNGDGTRESTISATLAGAISSGAFVEVSSIGVPQVPSATAFGSATIMETSPGVVLMDNLSGFGDADPPGSENAIDVTITSGSIALDLLTGNPTGSMDCLVEGEGAPLAVVVTFEPNGQGGFRTRFSGPGFDFTVP